MGLAINRDLGFAVAGWEEVSELRIDFRHNAVLVRTDVYESQEAFAADVPPFPGMGREVSLAGDDFPFFGRDMGRKTVYAAIAAKDAAAAEAQAREDAAMAELLARREMEAESGEVLA